MSKFDALYNTLVEAIPAQQPTTSTTPAATQPATNQPSTYNQQTAPKPATTTSTTPQKFDANNPVVKELVAAKDPNQVIAALQKLGIK